MPASVPDVPAAAGHPPVADPELCRPRRGWLLLPMAAAAMLGLPFVRRRFGARAGDGDDTIARIITDLERHDPGVTTHLLRVSGIVQDMVTALISVEDQARDAIMLGALVHDIGKIGIPAATLTKPGQLDPDEMRVVRRHSEIGQQLIDGVDGFTPAAPIVRHHHERWDGRGYPDGLAGDGIPIGARLIAVADSYDAMTSDRNYRRALPHETAIAELRAMSGTQFDPWIVGLFCRLTARTGSDMDGLFGESRGPAIAS